MGITAAQKTRLGIFVVCGMVLLAAFIIVPIWMKVSYRTVTYIAYFEEESLQGLEDGAAVKFNGVSIGRVERVSYIPDDVTRMKVEMSIAETFPMRVNMQAHTGFLGITGLKYVEITGGTNEAERLPPGGVIPTRRPLFSSIGERVDSLAVKVETLLEHLVIATTPDSLQALKIIMDNIAIITGDVKYITSDVRGVVPSVQSMLDTAQAAMNEVANITRDVKEITGVFSQRTLYQIDSTVASVQVLTDNLTTTLLQTREDFSVTMENLRDATESANQLLRMLAENPSLLIRGDVRERDRR